MSAKTNGTDAKEIALHFLKQIDQRATPLIMAKTIKQAKTILESEYTKEEIIQVIDHITSQVKITIYSLGYVSACINDVLRELREQEAILLRSSLKKEIASQSPDRSEVVIDDGSRERNREKARRIEEANNKKWDEYYKKMQ